MSDKTGIIKGVVEELTETAKSAVQQVTGTTEGVVKRDAPTEEIVKGLYQPSESSKPQSSQTRPQPPINDQVLLASLRQKLHKETYYEPLVRRKTQEEEQVEEVAQKQEETQQKQMELIEKEKKKEKPQAVQMASTKVERFRGASG
ncbi:MAG: hypothetical protein A3J69_01340 [Candidatus Levybacteria bacterium RIFCSPHIGHO2_02_FULL_42_12]|nr:MAG: hypothetical protein A3J69_01340 [Candidatus Levybacteria bacterium RIFCSPHIGHO2_02_FULL_42_12]OGH42938.1 MAG: hypothetical protein A3B53_02070 [Candidatus Levybacteria bacterium RIFCSPLOWO2_01_FULL_42_15]